MQDVAYVNGRFMPLAEAKISINDRGFLFGDGVYDTLAVYAGSPFLLEEHLARLKQCCVEVGIRAEGQIEELPEILSSGIKESGYSDGVIYIQITRGVQLRNAIIDPEIEPTLIVTFRPPIANAKEMRDRGVSVILRPDIRWGRRDIKSLNLLANVLMKNEAHREGAYEALLIDAEGNISESCSSNVFIVEGGVLLTRPLSNALIPGASRNYVLRKLAPELGFEVREEAFSPERLKAADEVFMTSTMYLTLPILEVEGEVIGRGVPGPVVQQLSTMWEENIAAMR